MCGNLYCSFFLLYSSPCPLPLQCPSFSVGFISFTHFRVKLGLKWSGVQSYRGIRGSCQVLTPVCVWRKYTWPCTVVRCSVLKSKQKNFVTWLEYGGFREIQNLSINPQTVWLTVSLWQVRRLVPMRSVLRGVAMASRVLPSDSLCLKATLLTGRVKPTVPTPRRTSGVGVGQRLFTETSLKHRPAHTSTHTPLKSYFLCFTGITW